MITHDIYKGYYISLWKYYEDYLKSKEHGKKFIK